MHMPAATDCLVEVRPLEALFFWRSRAVTLPPKGLVAKAINILRLAVKRECDQFAGTRGLDVALRSHAAEMADAWLADIPKVTEFILDERIAMY